MKRLAGTIASLLLVAAPSAHAEQAMLTPDDIRTVAPVLEMYRQVRLLGDLWKRPDLSPRDRSIMTLAALIEEIASEDWAEKVCRPDILGKPEQLYKKPGYAM